MKKITLFLTFSKGRAARLEREGLMRTQTLGGYVRDRFDRRDLRRLVDGMEAAWIVQHLIDSATLEHFAHLQGASAPTATAGQMAEFFLRCRRDGVSVEDFRHEARKGAELRRLFDDYEAFLASNGLADLADAERVALEEAERGEVKDIWLDDFEIHGIGMYESRGQKALVEALSRHAPAVAPPANDAAARLYGAEAFDRMGEMRLALRIARERLEEGAEPASVKIVVSAISAYAPLFKALLPEYGLRGYVRRGVPLKALAAAKGRLSDEAAERFRDAWSRARHRAEAMHRRLLWLGIEADPKTVLERVVEGGWLTLERVGVELLETNQLFGLDGVDHLIFVGADIGQFPPGREESLFHSPEEERRLFFGNPPYATSRAHYALMKETARHLYVLHATHRGKSMLTLSPIVSDPLEPCTPKVMADSERLEEGARVRREAMEPYLAAFGSEAPTPWDGADAGGETVARLSASRINRYVNCPRRYHYSYILGLQPPSRPTDEMEATTQGSVMHRAFELFALRMKRKEIPEGQEESAMRKIAEEAYREILAGEGLEPNFYFDLFFDGLVRGLEEESDEPGVLKNFLTYVREQREELADFARSEMERRFGLDGSLEPVEEESEAFITGYIDRLDDSETLRIHDYKSKRAGGIDQKKLAQIAALKDVQLGLYLRYATRRFPGRKAVASLITFKTGNDRPWAEFATLANYEIPKPPRMRNPHFVLYDEAYEEALAQCVDRTKRGIEAGRFVWDDSDEEQCGWCEFETFCKKRGGRDGDQ